MQIETPHFYLRPLKESDATETYLSWFADTATQRYIVSASENHTLENLRTYITEKLSNDRVLFLGIFAREDMRHIGNIKFEPIDSEAGYAIMGILIGDPEYRGKGVASAVIKASASWLKTHRKINKLLLGVHVDNLAAIRAYENIGFVMGTTEFLKPETPDTLVMIWQL